MPAETISRKKSSSSRAVRPTAEQMHVTMPSINATADDFDTYYNGLSPETRRKLGKVKNEHIYKTEDQMGSYRRHNKGIMILHASYGMTVLYGMVYDKWAYMNGDKGELGLPLVSVSQLKGKSYAVFERGMIRGKYEVHGAIYEKYCDLGREDSDLGLPVSDEMDTGYNDGRYSEFEKGNIYWQGDVGAFELKGKLLDFWIGKGGTRSIFGYPISGEMQVGETKGRFQRFQNAVMYSHPRYGTHEVHGLIREKWEALGGVTGWLGYPISDESSSSSGKTSYSTFQNGMIVWHPQFGAVAVKELVFYLDRFGSKGTDQRGLGGGQDMYVHIDISSSENEEWVCRKPKEGTFGSGKEMDLNVLKIPKVNHRSWIKVHLKAMDGDWIDGNDFLGVIDQEYNIDNLWGIYDDFEHWSVNFQAVYSIKNIVPLDPDAPFRNQYWWPFNNFSTNALYYSHYAQTFRDVESSEEWWLNPFNALYYEAVYKGIAKKGNCVGMCLEALYAMVGRSVFSQPIYQWGPQGGEPDPKSSRYTSLMSEMNIKHGYQTGSSCVDWVARQFLLGKTHDPKHVFYESWAEFKRGNYPILIVTPSMWKLGTHGVLPYHYEEMYGASGKLNNLRIHVADPNVEWTHFRGKINNIPVNDPTYIDINPKTNSFSFWHDYDDLWTGSTWTGGRFYYIPFSRLSSQPRTPFWEIFLLLASGAVLFAHGDSDSEQITDEDGNTFFKKNLRHLPEKYEDLNQDAKTRIPDFSHIPLADFQGTAPELFYCRNARAKKLTHKLRGNKNGEYKYMLRTPTIASSVETPVKKSGRDTITVKKISQPIQEVEVKTEETGKRISMRTQIKSAVNKDYRIMEVKDLPLVRNQPVRMLPVPGKEALAIENKGQESRITLRLETNIGGRQKIKHVSEVPIKAGKVLRFRPKTWGSITEDKTEFEVLDRVDGPVINRFKK